METGLKNRDIREGGTILTPGVMEMQPVTEQSSTSVELLQRHDTEQGRNKASPQGVSPQRLHRSVFYHSYPMEAQAVSFRIPVAILKTEITEELI